MAAEYRIQISIQLLIAAHVTFGMDPFIFGAVSPERCIFFRQ